MSIKKDLKYNLIVTSSLVGSMWLVHIIDYLWVFEKINSNGIVPRTFDGLDVFCGRLFYMVAGIILLETPLRSYPLLLLWYYFIKGVRCGLSFLLL